MSDKAGSVLLDPHALPRWWLIARGLLRAAATAAVLVALYYVLPLDHRSDGYVIIELALGVGLFLAMLVWELRAIVRSPYPGIRATQSLATITPLFLLIFASTYFMMGVDDSGTFTEQLSRTDALYFTITTFSTVGFGDITAVGQTARVVVMVQMLLDLVILGLGIQVLIGAVRRGRSTQGATGGAT